MAQITSLDTIVTALSTIGGTATNPQHLFSWKDPFVGITGSTAAGTPIAGRITSLWQYSGSPSGQGSNPGAISYPNSLTTGSMNLINASQATGELWLMSVSAAGLSVGTILLYDRLAQISGLSGTTTTAQTVSASAITRYTGSVSSVGNQIWLEIYVQIGATLSNITCNYKNQNGVSHTSPPTQIGATNYREVQRMIQIPLAYGDTGVTAVDSVTLTPSTGTAGDFGVTVLQPLCWMPVTLNGGVRDMVMDLPSIIKIEANACLALAFYANTTTLIQMMFSAKVIEI